VTHRSRPPAGRTSPSATQRHRSGSSPGARSASRAPMAHDATTVASGQRSTTSARAPQWAGSSWPSTTQRTAATSTSASTWAHHVSRSSPAPVSTRTGASPVTTSELRGATADPAAGTAARTSHTSGATGSVRGWDMGDSGVRGVGGDDPTIPPPTWREVGTHLRPPHAPRTGDRIGREAVRSDHGFGGGAGQEVTVRDSRVAARTASSVKRRGRVALAAKACMPSAWWGDRGSADWP
jgi:hypothetical protein